MGFLKDIFTKQKLTFSDEMLGEMTVTLNRNNTEEECLWKGEKSFFGQRIPTSLFIYGNANGPNKNHLAVVHKFVTEIPDVFQKLDDYLQTEPDFIEHYGVKWQDNFSLGDLLVEKEVGGGLVISVCLDPVGLEDDNYIVFDWVDRDVFNIEIQVGR